jgi:hypothetical protein
VLFFTVSGCFVPHLCLYLWIHLPHLKIESYENFANRKKGRAFRDRNSSVTLMNASCRSHLVPALSGSGFYPIGLINLGMKGAGARSAGNPHATCDVAGAGDGI